MKRHRPLTAVPKPARLSAALAAALATALAVAGVGWAPNVLLAAEPSASSGYVPGQSGRVVTGFAMPDARPRLSFDRTGTIKDIFVEKGQQVAEGDPIAVLDDLEEQERLNILDKELNAAQKRIEASKMELAQAQVELKRKERVAAERPGAINTEELERARLDAELGAVRVEIAEAELAKVEAEKRAQVARIGKMTLRSTINGTVEDVAYEKGEAYVDIDRPVAFLVNNNPVKVEVKSLDRDVIRRLNLGDELAVRFRPDEPWTPARITFIASLGDPRSNTSQMELQMPNPNNRPTGQTVEVLIPSPE
ncbi:MAG: efflux RND transporter periplasmic adaptor subunit [Phycisphaerae bacterium]